MAVSRTALLAVIAILVALCNVDAFVPAASTAGLRSLARPNARFCPLSVSVTTVDDLVGAPGEDEEESNEPAPEDFIVNAGDLEGEAAEVPADDDEPPSWFTHQQNLLELRQKYRRHESDTGSPEFQVAGMTERITHLTKHLKVHPKDFSTRRGLVALVNKRRRLLNYLAREDVNRYKELVSSLGIRHKVGGRVRSREEKYAQFPPQKERKDKKN